MGVMTAGQWAQRHQVWVYLAAVALAAGIGVLVPDAAGPAEAALTPLLGLLLFQTFLGVPVARLSAGLRDRRFLLGLALVDAVIAPVLAVLLALVLVPDPALRVGVLFVLLAPCVDWVLVFAGMAGGDRARLLAATPLLLFGQMLLLPPALALLAGPQVAGTVRTGPFLEAFVVLILLPLLAAVAAQAWAARRRSGARVVEVVEAGMVPTTALVLAAAVLSQIGQVLPMLGRLLGLVPVYLLFAAAMTLLGTLACRALRLDVPGARAVVFSGVARNSLVVLPLVLALPAELSAAAPAVVVQTLVELPFLLLLLRAVPRLLPERIRGPVAPTPSRAR
ncbi:arsenic resistance protein [Rothia kristinae]|uniref:arsenic resistance protein n=1 Tax=Rothia kristinae TaxID=37923 RepID=UPI00244AFFB4|nr:arsenic resistance protein [Rothia kristinae]WGH09989.1 arsenic resistance protein [Rothia kristinae]